ncbi:HET-domain-containing protein [Stipitochalara longipes BDJ]|nr:HET-domain-containing protein [Stipitochalara longipes BDJ]
MSTNGIQAPDASNPQDPDAGTDGTAREKKLCSRCQELDLSVDKFVIHDGFFRPPRKSSGPSHGPQFSLKSGNGLFQLGAFSDIERRSRDGCPLCFLAVKSVEPYTEGPQVNSGSVLTSLIERESICFVNWEIDGRDNDPYSGRKARTRRLHLHWNNTNVPDSYLVFVAPQRLFDFNSDSQGSWEPEAFFLGRELRTNGNNQVLMKSWLDRCSKDHGPSCSGEYNDEFLEMANQSYFGVIDTLDMCLKSLPLRQGKSPKKKKSSEDGEVVLIRQDRGAPYGTSPSEASIEENEEQECDRDLYEPYVALSYVWGLTKNYTTDIFNIRIHQQQGSLETFLDKIPKVIRDAMELVRRLGLRYLWVDSLCIVQNSRRSWNLNARMMNVIYGNAHLTICAADGSDAWCGLKALDSSGHSTIQHIQECAPGVRLMVSQLAETGINSSVWNTRAWTFQERLLSKSCLIFTEGRVFFQCRSATMSEDLVSESHGAGWSLDLAKSLPQILHELKRRPIRVYMNCMSRYSERQLTQPKDILAAFNGVSNMISDVMRAPFMFGLPSSHFDLALLWEPLSAVSRRIPGEREDFGDFIFPSWSWCGWKGGSMSYRTCQLEGVLINVHEWLTEHTWIAWYIRDGRGNLRPVWDGEISKACDSVEERWKGYKDVLPEPEFTRLQEEALMNLGNPNEDDFNKWAKEQEVAAKEAKLVELDRKARGPYGDPYREYAPPPRRRRARSSSSERQRDRDAVSVQGINGDDNTSPTFTDEYGRKISLDVAKRIRSGFQQCLPDNPFRVYIEPYTATPDKDFPDQPLLQFWTWWASLRLSKAPPPSPNSSNENTLPGLTKFDISDAVGDWCGSILLSSSWVSSQERLGHAVDGSRRDFLAISDAKAFTKEECDVWTYYVPKERETSEWELYYVLLVEMKERIWYRVAVGKVFKQAFENAVGRKRWREIILG